MKTLREDVVLVTTTFSKTLDDVRAQLALKTCRSARENGYPIIVVDGSPCQEFKTALRETGATVINQQKPGMGQSRREAFRAGCATGAKCITWIEPEKYTIVHLLQESVNLILEGKADMVIPRRQNLDNYPHYQQWSEYVGNWKISNITGRHDLDLYIGPRVLSRNTTALMELYEPEGIDKTYGDNWEILFIPVLWALNMGWRVSSVLVDYIHPDEQKSEDGPDMMAKRDTQRHELIRVMEKEAVRIGYRTPI